VFAAHHQLAPAASSPHSSSSQVSSQPTQLAASVCLINTPPVLLGRCAGPPGGWLRGSCCQAFSIGGVGQQAWCQALSCERVGHQVLSALSAGRLLSLHHLVLAGW